MSDLISRQAAIDELIKMLSDCFYADEEVLDAVKTTLNELSSAQSEPLTDKEQRIFLAAMSKEEKVCRKVDKEVDGDINLIHVCHEIERKVKGVLWT